MTADTSVSDTSPDERGAGRTPTIPAICATLVTAATILEATGWAQGALVDGDGRVDAVRAIVMAAEENDLDAWFAVWEVELLLGGTSTLSDLAGWQDVPGRTRDDVCRLLRNVARLLRDRAARGARSAAA